MILMIWTITFSISSAAPFGAEVIKAVNDRNVCVVMNQEAWDMSKPGINAQERTEVALVQSTHDESTYGRITQLKTMSTVGNKYTITIFLDYCASDLSMTNLIGCIVMNYLHFLSLTVLAFSALFFFLYKVEYFTKSKRPRGVTKRMQCIRFYREVSRIFMFGLLMQSSLALENAVIPEHVAEGSPLATNMYGKVDSMQMYSVPVLSPSLKFEKYEVEDNTAAPTNSVSPTPGPTTALPLCAVISEASSVTIASLPGYMFYVQEAYFGNPLGSCQDPGGYRNNSACTAVAGGNGTVTEIVGWYCNKRLSCTINVRVIKKYFGPILGNGCRSGSKYLAIEVRQIDSPTSSPTISPSTLKPTSPTTKPTRTPSSPSFLPTVMPFGPSPIPTLQPSLKPSSSNPSMLPTICALYGNSRYPTIHATTVPSSPSLMPITFLPTDGTPSKIPTIARLRARLRYLPSPQCRPRIRL